MVNDPSYFFLGRGWERVHYPFPSVHNSSVSKLLDFYAIHVNMLDQDDQFIAQEMAYQNVFTFSRDQLSESWRWIGFD